MMARLAKTVYTIDNISKGAVRKMGCTNSLVSTVRLMIGPSSWKLAFNHNIVLTGFCRYTHYFLVSILRTACHVAYVKHLGDTSQDIARQQRLQ